MPDTSRSLQSEIKQQRPFVSRSQEGAVAILRTADDRRSVVCRISDRGMHLLSGLDAPIEAADRALFGGLSDAELEQLLGLLQTIRTGGG